MPAGILSVIVFYLLKSLIEAGQPIFDALNTGDISQIRLWQVGVILLAVAVAGVLFFILEFLKSIWDAAFKKSCEDSAKVIVEWIEK